MKAIETKMRDRTPTKLWDRITRMRATLALGLVGLAMLFQGSLINILARGADYNPFDFVNDPLGSFLIVLGLIVLVLFAILLAARAIPAHPKTVGGIFATIAVLLLVGFAVMSAVNLPTSAIATSPTAAVSSYITTTLLQTGCSVVQSTNTMTCDVAYNLSASYFYVCTGNLSAGAGRSACIKNNYVLFQLHSARTDIQNSTYGFSYQVASVATVTTTGSTPTVYSPLVGYVPATSTSSGIWKAFWGSGSAASQNPTQAAPQVTSGWTPSVLGIGAFNSGVETLHLSLPGTNSTSAPFAMYQAMTLYGSYSMTTTVSQSTPTTFTLTLVLVGGTN